MLYHFFTKLKIERTWISISVYILQLIAFGPAFSQSYSFESYVNECKKELKWIPTELSCFGPGSTPAESQPSALLKEEDFILSFKEISQSNFVIETQKPGCNRPVFLNADQPCAPNNRIVLRLSPDRKTRAVMYCRNYNFRRDSSYFDDINFFIERTETMDGELVTKSCWFNSRVNSTGPYTTSGYSETGLRGDQAMDLDNNKETGFWQSHDKPESGYPCMFCHNNGPYIRSAQLKGLKVDGVPVIPDYLNQGRQIIVAESMLKKVLKSKIENTTDELEIERLVNRGGWEFPGRLKLDNTMCAECHSRNGLGAKWCDRIIPAGFIHPNEISPLMGRRKSTSEIEQLLIPYYHAFDDQERDCYLEDIKKLGCFSN